MAQLWSLMLMVPLYVLNETCRWINQWTCLYSFCFTFFHDQNNTYVAFVVTRHSIASISFLNLNILNFVNLGFMILRTLIFCSLYLEGLSDIRWIYSCRRAARNKQKGIAPASRTCMALLVNLSDFALIWSYVELAFDFIS